MNETLVRPATKELAMLPVARTEDILLARLVAREQASRLAFATNAITQIATAVSEITRNVLQHAGAPGQFKLFEMEEAGRVGLKITITDDGSGIRDVDRVLVGASPGAGIPGARRLMDEFNLHSTVKSGTAVTMIKWRQTEIA